MAGQILIRRMGLRTGQELQEALDDQGLPYRLCFQVGPGTQTAELR